MRYRFFGISFFVGIIIFILCNSQVYAQKSEYGKLHRKYNLSYRTFRVTLVPGLSTNGIHAGQYASKYSWNIIAGYNGALDNGFEFGGFVNINKYYAHGGQIAGIANVSGRETSGIQLAGMFNYAAEEMQGIQLSGTANISRGDQQGIQLTGGLNWSGGVAQGIQASGLASFARNSMQGLFFSGVGTITSGHMQGIAASGLVNYFGGDTQGILASGFLNHTRDFQGITIGSVNISKEMQGIQIGNINISSRAQGIQLGLINYAREMDGLPIGLISYYENGRTNVDVWTSDAGFINTGVKLGTEEVYNMISIGFNPALARDVWQLGWSIGRLHEYTNHRLYTDLSILKINEGKWTKDLNSLFKYRLLFGKELYNGLHLYGGPTFNMLISRVSNSNSYTWYRLFDFGAKGRSYVFWIGYSLGIELF